MKNQNTEELYAPFVSDARNRINSDPVLAQILDKDINAKLLHLFAIQWCAQGVYTTKPVDGWIRRAGEACLAIGLTEVGTLLCDHAKHEAGHESMMINDTKFLVDEWNSRYPEHLDAEVILAKPPLESVQRYAKLHEDTILSDMPFAQIAIELEIEKLSVSLGPKLMAHFHAILGDEIANQFTFLPEHIVLDVGHTHYNTGLLERCLSAMPDKAEMLGQTGSDALNIYIDFLSECFTTCSTFFPKQA